MSHQPEALYKGRFLNMLRLGTWEYAERTNVSDIASIVTVTGGGEAIFVEQWRIPLQAHTIEWPAGLIGDGSEPESLEAGANRELEEETGYRAESFETLATLPSSAGLTSEIVRLVLARGVRRIGDGGGVHDETIRVHHVALADAEPWLRAQEAEGKLVDPKVWAGLYFLRPR